VSRKKGHHVIVNFIHPTTPIKAGRVLGGVFIGFDFSMPPKGRIYKAWGFPNSDLMRRIGKKLIKLADTWDRVDADEKEKNAEVSVDDGR
jgi:hypothetical protein